MNRTISRLLASVLFVSAAMSAASSSETNRTNVRLRDYRNRAEVATIAHRAAGLSSDDRANGTLSVMPFYRQTWGKDRLGKGFGVNNNHVVEAKTGAFAKSATEVFAANIIHDHATQGASVHTAKFTLQPKHYAFGANLCYFQKLDSLWEGLFFDINTAVAKTYNKIDLSVSDDTDVATGASTTKWAGYFTGQANTLAASKSAALTNAKISYDTYQDETGVEDIELCLGYQFAETDMGSVCFDLAASVPVGTTPKGDYLWEPVVGGRHFKLGAGVTGKIDLWNDDAEDRGFKACFDLNYRYAFKRDVTMTPGLKGRAWGQYSLLGKVAAGNIVELVPAANVITADYEVTPGSMVDGYAMLSFNTGNLCVDFGVSGEFAQGHTAKNKTFKDGEYGVAAIDLQVGGAVFDAAAQLVNPVNIADLDLKLESMVIGKLFIAVGGVMDDMDFPVHYGLGADVDFASKRQITPENWKIFGKVGVTF